MWERRIRFSAIRYSHCGSRRWFTRPVIYANNRTHLLSRIGNQHGTGVAPTLATSILTKRGLYVEYGCGPDQEFPDLGESQSPPERGCLQRAQPPRDTE